MDGDLAKLALAMPDMRIVAMDLEYGDDTEPFVELGIARWDCGVRSGRHIIVGEHPGPIIYRHGMTERLPLGAACRVLTDELWDADAIAGHDLSGDRLRLNKVGLSLRHLPTYDTAKISKRIFTPGLQAQLRAMLQIYGISTEGIHNAGNDAWAVIDLLVEMTRQGTAPCAGPDGTYRHPRERSDILRDRRTRNGYVVEPGGRETP
ncbi:hypothetical protein [Sphingomonas sp. 3-13AW]|uniref:hypothetical protein n=1 Tax=Sphingomonas sp. 3-13AW TaxID=3050450 RepID=UPI003BB6556E